MINEISIRGFKSLRDVSLSLGELNVFIGTNASGKTNFFDALRVLQGIGFGFTIDEILNGKPKTSSSDFWEPIRGGSGNAAYRRWDQDQQEFDLQEISLSVLLSSYNPPGRFRYSITISAARACVTQEKLTAGGMPVYDSGPAGNDPDSPTFAVLYYAGQRGRQPHLHFEKSRPVLVQMLRTRNKISKHNADSIEMCSRLLSDTQRLDPSPAFLRDYSQAPVVPRMGERGENFAAVVNAILKDESAASAYTSWLAQLTPAELDSVTILSGALGEPLFALKQRGRVLPAPVLSDGTLRFAALAAAFFQPDMPQILLLEELENGIHPTRLRVLVELLKSQTRAGGPQVLATTHSPIVLSWLTREDYETTFFCKKDDETGASTITPLTKVPALSELVTRQPLTDLFAEGWLEAAP